MKYLKIRKQKIQEITPINHAYFSKQTGYYPLGFAITWSFHFPFLKGSDIRSKWKTMVSNPTRVENMKTKACPLQDGLF